MAQPTPRPLLARLNWYWIFQAAGWIMVALFMMAMYRSFLSLPGVALTAWWTALSGLLLSDAWHRLLKRRHWGAPRVRWPLFAMPALVMAPLQMASVTVGILLIQGSTIDTLEWVPMALMFWSAIFLGWTACYLLVLAVRRAARYEAEALKLEVAAKDSELRALQAQVNPHFFFNSLNSVRALIYQEPDAAARMIDQLASLMRYALQSGQNDTVPLATELEVVDAYLAIEKIRFEERLRVSLHIDAGLERVMLPPMALQTLVENAVKYGVEVSASGSDIRITARRDGGCVRIEIANTGAILPFANSTRVGVHNARKRLALAVGDAARLDLSEHGGWVRATLTLPSEA